MSCSSDGRYTYSAASSSSRARIRDPRPPVSPGRRAPPRRSRSRRRRHRRTRRRPGGLAVLEAVRRDPLGRDVARPEGAQRIVSGEPMGVEELGLDLQHLRPSEVVEVQVGPAMRDLTRFVLRISGFQGRHIGVHRLVEERLQARAGVRTAVGVRPVGEDPDGEVHQRVGGFRPDVGGMVRACLAAKCWMDCRSFRNSAPGTELFLTPCPHSGPAADRGPAGTGNTRMAIHFTPRLKSGRQWPSRS